jgi:hypothetical protein
MDLTVSGGCFSHAKEKNIREMVGRAGIENGSCFGLGRLLRMINSAG